MTRVERMREACALAACVRDNGRNCGSHWAGTHCVCPCHAIRALPIEPGPTDEEVADELGRAYQRSYPIVYQEAWLAVARKAKELLCVDNRQSE